MADTSHQLAQLASNAFGSTWAPVAIARAPGRLELLGNHVDYNGGLVLAGAIDRTVNAIAGRSDGERGSVRLFAPDVSPDIETVSTSDPSVRHDSGSTSPGDYLAGIITALHQADIPVQSDLEIVVSGDVPLGFGMSSSAALCVSLAMLLAAEELPPQQLVDIARRAEHITGAPVGAMDQSASVAGGVILFNGTSGEVETLNPDLDDYVFAVANSGIHHALGQSEYPTRVQESQEALALIQANTALELNYLGEIEPEQWRDIVDSEPAWLSPLLRQRVEHVVMEVERVRRGVDAIETRDWERFGALMTASGRSSASEYDISHPVVEELVSALLEVPGVLGARMMGGGEGGPALALLHRRSVPIAQETLASSVFARQGLDAEEAFKICTFGPGASVEPLSGPA